MKKIIVKFYNSKFLFETRSGLLMEIDNSNGFIMNDRISNRKISIKEKGHMFLF